MWNGSNQYNMNKIIKRQLTDVKYIATAEGQVQILPTNDEYDNNRFDKSVKNVI